MITERIRLRIEEARSAGRGGYVSRPIEGLSEAFWAVVEILTTRSP
jgi:hypothetical protein